MRYGFGIDPQAKIWQLSIGAQQKVEIIKLLLAGAKLLIFDEPTSVLAPHEAEGLFKIFDSLRQSGYTIIFISHKLNEVLACCDAITVLRQGRVVGSLPRAEATEQELVSLIVGSQSRSKPRLRAQAGSGTMRHPVVELRGVEALDDRGRQALRGCEPDDQRRRDRRRCGRIGQRPEGTGRGDPGRAPDERRSVADRRPGVPTGRSIGAAARRRAWRASPKIRWRWARCGAMTVEENLALGDARRRAAAGCRSNWPAARAKASWLTERFQLKMPRLHVPIDRAFGRQRPAHRLSPARWRSGPGCCWPTIRRAAWISTPPRSFAPRCWPPATRAPPSWWSPRIWTSWSRISDRIVVMYHGQHVGECTPEQADIHEIGFLMTDGKRAGRLRARGGYTE